MKTITLICGVLLFMAFPSLAEEQMVSQYDLINWTNPASPFKQSPVIIDVRPHSEFKKGHVPLAINIPHSDILDDPGLLEPYKGRDIVVYCWSGSKATKVLSHLDALGYPALYHLNGDMQDWLTQGHEVAF